MHTQQTPRRFEGRDEALVRERMVCRAGNHSAGADSPASVTTGCQKRSGR